MTAEAAPQADQGILLAAIEDDLRQSLADLEPLRSHGLVDMIRYHLGWSVSSPSSRGKRVRPLLTLLSCESAGGDWRKALPAASAVELIHNFSLVHDDIEDGSESRRGRPTVWKKWGVPQALNAGDAIFTLARLSTHRLLASNVEPQAVLNVQHVLDRACLMLTLGQHLDLAFECLQSVTEDDYFAMIEGKTSSLLAAATTVGAIVAGADSHNLERYRVFGHHLGLAFQLLDDILGTWGSIEVTGKPSGDDLVAHKKTLPVIHGLENSDRFRQLWSAAATGSASVPEMARALEEAGSLAHTRHAAERHTDLALAALDNARPCQPAGQTLRTLALLLLSRSS